MGVIKKIKQIFETQTTLLMKKAGTFKEEDLECFIDEDLIDCADLDELEAPLFECGSGHLTQGYGFYVGVSSPEYLEDDAWFGSAILSDSQIFLKEAFEHAVSDGQLLPEDNTVEPKDIHEVIYNIATHSQKTTTQLNPTLQFGSGSENFQEGWQSGTSLGQFR